MQSLKTVSSLKVVINLNIEKYFKKNEFQNLLISLYDDIDIESINNDHYIIELTHILMKYDILKNVDFKIFIVLVKSFIKEPENIDKFSDILIYLMKLNLIDPIKEAEVVSIIEQLQEGWDINYINAIINLINFIGINNKNINEILNREIEYHLEYFLEEASNEINMSEYVKHEQTSEYDYDTVIDYYGIESSIESELNHLIDEINQSKYVEIDYLTLVHNINIDDLVDKFFSNFGDSNYDEDRYHGVNENKMNNIEDLFER